MSAPNTGDMPRRVKTRLRLLSFATASSLAGAEGELLNLASARSVLYGKEEKEEPDVFSRVELREALGLVGIQARGELSRLLERIGKGEPEPSHNADKKCWLPHIPTVCSLCRYRIRLHPSLMMQGQQGNHGTYSCEACGNFSVVSLADYPEKPREDLPFRMVTRLDSADFRAGKSIEDLADAEFPVEWELMLECCVEAARELQAEQDAERERKAAEREAEPFGRGAGFSGRYGGPVVVDIPPVLLISPGDMT